MPPIPQRLPNVLYNENNPYAAQWLRNLSDANGIPKGTVSDKSITELTAKECKPTSHFFAGIGGWPLALRLAGWDDNQPVWSGSCPCQPFSVCGKGEGVNDERHLWPAFYNLIQQCRPPIVFGEQVSGNNGRTWLAGVRLDLENAGYVVAAADLSAACIASPHNRSRLFWVAYAKGSTRVRPIVRQNPWINYRVIDCTDGGKRRINQESVDEPLVNGIPRDMGSLIAELDGLGVRASDARRTIQNARRNKDGRMLGYGNAIIPQLAAQFIVSACQAIEELSNAADPAKV